MTIRTLIAAFALVAAGLVSAPATAQTVDLAHHSAERGHHACTRTSSGSCIRGGEFCPQKSYGKSGWDAKGRRYVCKGNHTHPHWMKP